MAKAGRIDMSGDAGTKAQKKKTKKPLTQKQKEKALKRIAAGVTAALEKGEEVNADIPEEVAKLLSLRKKARKAKNWATSDSLRASLLKLGWIVSDLKGQQVLASVAAKDENKAALAKAQAKKDAKKMRDDEPGEEASSLLGSLRRS